MTATRQRMVVILGGRSAEHEVSVTSARGVMREADPARFEVVPVGITKGGRWLTVDETRARLAQVEAGERRDVGNEAIEGAFMPAEVLSELEAADVVFPVVHGTFGEDGTLQGLLEMADVPYVGPGVAASAVGMDKGLMRAVFAAAGIPQARYLVLEGDEAESPSGASRQAVASEIGYPCFVKPANGGSSVGVSKARSSEDLGDAIAAAVAFDRKVLVEEALEGQEVECAVLGHRDPQPSPLGEIEPSTEFYDYDAKYVDDSAALIVPARVDPDTARTVQGYAVRAFKALGCSGLSRVDFFVEPGGGVKCIEVNTLPGFTPISMYPRLWQEAGVSYRELISRLVDFALERHAERRGVAPRG